MYVLVTLIVSTWAAVIHIDVPAEGGVSVDIDADSSNIGSKPARLISSPSFQARVLGDYQVDLGYEIHQGFLSVSQPPDLIMYRSSDDFKKNEKFVAFSNVPYAEPPLGENRFIEPIAIYNERETVNNGTVEHICPQMQVGWASAAASFLEDYSNSGSSLDKWTKPIGPVDYGKMPEQDSRSTSRLVSSRIKLI